jgi:hypothetical protein
MISILYRVLYYVSPPIDQYLKFKNHCSLMYSLVACKSPSQVKLSAASLLCKIKEFFYYKISEARQGVLT